MERSALKILGKKGRITIPLPIRSELHFLPGDLLLFESDPPDQVIISRIKIVEPDKAGEIGLIGDIFTQEFQKLSYSQQYRLLTALLAEFHAAYN
jgi:AbrB family looped-hinge helix DNA binding protein